MKAAEDAKKHQSPIKDDQIDGIIGTAKDINSNANSNKASQKVTDKSLGVIGQVAHKENQLLDEIKRAGEEALSTQSGAQSPFYGQTHTLNEPRSAQRSQSSISGTHSSTSGPLHLTTAERNQVQRVLTQYDDVIEQRRAAKKERLTRRFLCQSV
jgi:hypothetical protein